MERTSAAIDLIPPADRNISSLVLSLDAAAWLAGVDVNSLVPEADGVVHLSSAANTALLQEIEQQAGNDAMLRPESSTDGVADE